MDENIESQKNFCDSKIPNSDDTSVTLEPDTSVAATKLNYISLASSIVLFFVFSKTTIIQNLKLKAIGIYSYTIQRILKLSNLTWCQLIFFDTSVAAFKVAVNQRIIHFTQNFLDEYTEGLDLHNLTAFWFCPFIWIQLINWSLWLTRQLCWNCPATTLIYKGNTKN